jgi:hypothetical protein
MRPCAVLLHFERSADASHLALLSKATLPEASTMHTGFDVEIRRAQCKGRLGRVNKPNGRIVLDAALPAMIFIVVHSGRLPPAGLPNTHDNWHLALR